MTDAELSALESLARAATPGPWDCDALSTVRSMNNDYRGVGIVYCAIDSTGRVPTINNAAYIAAANPATVLELIAELRQVKAERDWLANNLENIISCDSKPWLQAAKEAVCQE